MKLLSILLSGLLCCCGLADEVVLSDFESLEGWSGLVPDLEVVKEGKQSGFWADASAVNSVSTTSLPRDWSEYKGIKLWIHSTTANGQDIDVIVMSRTVGMDYFQCRFELNWTGWKLLSIPFYRFWPVRQVAGWDKIDSFMLSASWNDTPRQDTTLRLDDLRLTDDVPRQFRELMTDRELIEELDLERPGLEDVSALAAQEDWSGAAAALLDYSQALREVRHLTDPNEQRPAPDANYNTGRADHVLKHEFAFYGSDYHFLGETIDWEANPVGDYEWPTSLNRHGPLAALSRAWWYTGESKYAAEAGNFVQQWIAAARVPNVATPNVYWSTLNIASRLSTWPEVWIRLGQAEAFGPGARLEMLKMFFHQAEYLTNYHGGGNWLITESKALLGTSLLLPEFKRSAAWEREALDWLTSEIERQTYPSGAQHELTPHYHLVCIGGFVTPVYLMRKNERDMSPEYLERLERMYEYTMYVSKPDRCIPMLNDSDHNNIQGMMAAADTLFDRSDMRFVATDGQEGVAPAEASIALTWAGQYVMRTDWGSDALYLLLDAGPFGTGHQHEDKLNVDIHAYGSDLILDPGRFTYAGGKWRSFFLESGGHNVILVDGGGQARRSTPRENWVADGPMPVTWASTDAFDYVRGHYDEGFRGEAKPQVTHTRAIWSVKPAYWVVADFLRPEDEGEHEYEMYWHFGDGEATVEEGAITFVGETAGIHVAPQIEDAGVEVIKGREEPPQGWISYWYGRKRPAPTAKYSIIGGEVDIPTVLYPFPGNEPARPSVTRLTVEGGTGVKVDRGEAAEVIVFAAPGAETVRWEGFQTDGEAFCLQYDGDGELVAAFVAAGSYLRSAGTALVEEAEKQASAQWRK